MKTQAEFSVKFGVELVSIFQKLKEKGIDTQRDNWLCEITGGSFQMMQQCGTNLGALAEQLP